MKREVLNPVVERVRAVRRQIAQEFGCDVHRYAEYLRQREKATALKARRRKAS